MELYTGELLFATVRPCVRRRRACAHAPRALTRAPPQHENLEHLALLERCLGPLPAHMLARAGKSARKYVSESGRLRWPEKASSRDSQEHVAGMKRLEVRAPPRQSRVPPH